MNHVLSVSECVSAHTVSGVYVKVYTEKHWSPVRLSWIEYRRFLAIARFQATWLFFGFFYFFRNLWGVLCSWNAPRKMLLYYVSRTIDIWSSHSHSNHVDLGELSVGLDTWPWSVCAHIYSDTTKPLRSREVMNCPILNCSLCFQDQESSTPSTSPHAEPALQPQGLGVGLHSLIFPMSRRKLSLVISNSFQRIPGGYLFWYFLNILPLCLGNI